MGTRRLILITGIPGTGKTFMGNYLQTNHGFQHVNREAHRPPEFTEDPRAFIETHQGDMVATWGFRPLPDENGVNDFDGVIMLRDVGFFVVWFDGDRPAALREFIRREREEDPTKRQVSFYKQMFYVESSGVVSALNAPQINTFDANGEFCAPESITSTLLDLWEVRR